jgi:hypothetical protein
MASRPRYSFVHRNGLSIFALSFFLLFWALQAWTGWLHHNEELVEKGGVALSFGVYLGSGAFAQATFENWESEFLQMFLYVLATVSLRQQGSSESKKLEGKEDVDREPKPSPQAPWAVRKGGIWLFLYKQSLSLAFLLLFLLSFGFHAWGSYADYRSEELLTGGTPDGVAAYFVQPRFWFESFQNWQSEFLAIASIVILSIWLRQHGSPESKPVDMPDDENP